VSLEFGIEQIRPLIEGEIGREIILLEAVDSTNRLAMELGVEGASHGTVVIADRQFKGRGRLGRMWVSPPLVNIYMSIILRPDIRLQDATFLTIMAGLACARAIRAVTGLQVKLKWPNDLVYSDKKLGGILTEIRSGEEGIIFAVIGTGINVNACPGDFPPDIRPIATSIRNETSKGQPRSLLIASILNEMDLWYGLLRRSGRKPLLDEWRRLTSTLGRAVMVSTGEGAFRGVAEDIDDDGMLILRLPSGGVKRLSAGDLTTLR